MDIEEKNVTVTPISYISKTIQRMRSRLASLIGRNLRNASNEVDKILSEADIDQTLAMKALYKKKQGAALPASAEEKQITFRLKGLIPSLQHKSGLRISNESIKCSMMAFSKRKNLNLFQRAGVPILDNTIHKHIRSMRKGRHWTASAKNIAAVNAWIEAAEKLSNPQEVTEFLSGTCNL